MDSSSEITKVELAESVPSTGNAPTNPTFVSGAKLLKNVEKYTIKAKNFWKKARGDAVSSKEQRNSLIGEQDIEAINKQFNEDLEEYIKDNLPTGFRFNLGIPSKYLISGGFDNLPISMRASLISRKAGDNSHPFTPSELKDLVLAIQKPIAIFKYSKDNMRNLIVDIGKDGKHFLIGVTLDFNVEGNHENSVSGLFPKEDHEWIKWIQDGKHIRIDQKDKVQSIISSLRTNPAESTRIGLNLESVAKTVNEFENPTIPEEKSAETALISLDDKIVILRKNYRINGKNKAVKN